MLRSIIKKIIINRISRIQTVNIHKSIINNAGHSKWANIRHTKAEKDGQRAKLFEKLSRQIRLAIQDGDSTNPKLNVDLKSAIEQALNKNMPAGTIQNIIKRAEQNKLQLKKYVIQIKAFQRIYFSCIAYTDNITLLKQNLAPILKKSNGSYVDEKHLFEDCGIVEVILNENDFGNDYKKLEEKCTEDAIECGVEEIEFPSKGIVNFLCNPLEINRVCNELIAKGYKIDSADHVFIPKVFVNISDSELNAVNSFISKVKSIDGIEEIYDNVNPDIR